jgi:ABC-type polysaccharide/polyol phosphate transport system ATPase subunit
MAYSIQVDQVSKRYRMGKGLTNLRELFSPRKASSHQKYHWAVRDVSFQLEPGEALGIIGPNGAGKTTILKLLSQVTRPTSGHIQMNGRFSALIELGAGFHQDLTGRENIYLNGTILGMKRSEIKARFDEIVDFAGIGEYLDTPVKRYSSGMYARLGFSIAAHVDPQILLVDEVLAVGDYAFQQKCFALMTKLRAKGTTLIFVSHNMEAVRLVCERGIVMYRGENIFQGTAAEAVVAYSEEIRRAAKKSELEVPTEGGLSQLVMTFDAEIESARLLDISGRTVTVLKSGETAIVAVDVVFRKNVHKPVFSMTIRTLDGRMMYDTTTSWMNVQTPDFLAGERCRVEFEINIPLLENEYQLGVDISAFDYSVYYDRLERATNFIVEGGNGAKGIVDLGAKIDIKKIIPDGKVL